MLLAPLAALAACGSDTSNGDPGLDGGTLLDGSSSGSGDANFGDPNDSTPPTVISTDPANAASGVSPAAVLTVTFSERMSAPSVTTAGAFSVTRDGVAVPGTVTYADNDVTFVPTAPFALGATYQATISTAAKDLAGNALGAPFVFAFSTDSTAPLGPSPVRLGTAANYVVIAKSELTNVPVSNITGNVAISPAAASYITGFSMTNAGTFWTSAQVTGKIYAANNDAPTPSNLTVAIGDMEIAYTDAAGRPAPSGAFLDVGGGAIGGTTLTPGLYRWTSDVTIPTDMTLSGAANDIWIFQITGSLTMSANKTIVMSGGARAKNVFWQVAGLVELGASAHAEGTVLSKTAVKLGTGASLKGRLLAQTAVSLAGNTIVPPAP